MYFYMRAVPFVVPVIMKQFHLRLVKPSNSPRSRQLSKYWDPYSDLLFHCLTKLYPELWDTPYLGRVEGMLYHVVQLGILCIKTDRS